MKNHCGEKPTTHTLSFLSLTQSFQTPTLTHFWIFCCRQQGLCAQQLTDHGGASGQRRLGALVEVISGGHAPIGHLETSVHIDATGHQHPTMGIDGFYPTGHNEVFPDLSELKRKATFKLLITPPLVILESRITNELVILISLITFTIF